jgi:hypothetical protein
MKVFKVSRGVQAFKQTDVTKALKAALKAGVSIQRYEIDRDGKIIVHASKSTSSSATDVQDLA